MGTMPNESSSTISTTGSAAGKSLRKEIRNLTRAEWSAYAKAIVAWRDGDLGDKYMFPTLAAFVSFHAEATLNATADQVHEGGNFVTWHGVATLEFERAIQAYDPSVAAHYWDYTDASMDRIFGADFYGSGNSSFTRDGSCQYELLDGAFAEWPMPRVKDVHKPEWLTWTEKWPGLLEYNATTPLRC